MALNGEADPQTDSDVRRLLAWLESLPDRMQRQRRRLYGGDWSDWEGGSTGIREPALYVLWSEEGSLLYVGKTTDLGQRLSRHFGSQGWSEAPHSVSYLCEAAFSDPAMLNLAEKFVMAVYRPTNNDLAC